MILPAVLARHVHVHVHGPCRLARKSASLACKTNLSLPSLSQGPHRVSSFLCWKSPPPNWLGQPLPITPFRFLQTTSSVRQTESQLSSTSSNELLLSQMQIRLLNENGFLSWCRNAYIATVAGVAMMGEATSALAQSAGLGALMVGTMNLAWGTGCHVTNLWRLRHVSGMSSLTLFLHLAGSSLHCFLWAFVLICFIGFLDEASERESEAAEEAGKKRNSLLRRV